LRLQVGCGQNRGAHIRNIAGIYCKYPKTVTPFNNTFNPKLLLLPYYVKNSLKFKRAVVSMYGNLAKIAILSALKHIVNPNPSKPTLNMEKKDRKTWFRRIGIIGFTFFLVKGLLWLALFCGLFKVGCS